MNVANKIKQMDKRERALAFNKLNKWQWHEILLPITEEEYSVLPEFSKDPTIKTKYSEQYETFNQLQELTNPRLASWYHWKYNLKLPYLHWFIWRLIECCKPLRWIKWNIVKPIKWWLLPYIRVKRRINVANITSVTEITNELRPCKANSKNALFHK